MSRHDTAAIRRLADRLSSTATSLSNSSRSAEDRISGANGDLQGDTAQAINDSLDRLTVELRSIRNGLNQCAGVLNRYAHELDEADAEAGRMIRSH